MISLFLLTEMTDLELFLAVLKLGLLLFLIVLNLFIDVKLIKLLYNKIIKLYNKHIEKKEKGD